MRWSNYAEDWPEGFRPCLQCDQMKPYSEFHKHKNCKGGYNSVCKTCRKPKSKQDYSNKTREELLYSRAKSRAAVKGWEFDLCLEDIEIPDICPALKIQMVPGTDTAPSLDRIDSSKGYVKGNIQVISTKANAMKSNATNEEIKLLYQFLSGGCEIV